MSTLIDVSFSNPGILAYFEDQTQSVAAPVSELLFVHSHPLVSPNFVAQVEEMVNVSVESLLTSPAKMSVIHNLEPHIGGLGECLPFLTDENAEKALDHLRAIYQTLKPFIDTPRRR